MADRERGTTPPAGCDCSPMLHAQTARMDTMVFEVREMRHKLHKHANEIARLDQAIVELDPTVERVTELRIMEARLEKLPAQIEDLQRAVAGLERTAAKWAAVAAVVAAMLSMFGGRMLDRLDPPRSPWRDAATTTTSTIGGKR